jgi:hypothetical protein
MKADHLQFLRLHPDVFENTYKPRAHVRFTVADLSRLLNIRYRRNERLRRNYKTSAL